MCSAQLVDIERIAKHCKNTRHFVHIRATRRMAAAPEVKNNRNDVESKEYVEVKGPVTQWELDVPNGRLSSFFTLRIFGLKLGFSTVIGVGAIAF